MSQRYLVNFSTNELPQEFTEYLVIGTGIAGLYSALKASRTGEVTILTKKKLEDSNTEYAQGGIAAAIDQDDSPLFHYEDTINAGAGLCDPDAVEVLVNEGPERVKELVEMGTNFDKIGDVLALTREGAHSHRRILHAKGDATGEEIRRALARQIKQEDKVKVYENSFVIDLLTDEGTCKGVLAIDENGNKKVFWAKVIILASGGIGQLYKNTTNPDVATGDGIAMAYRAGAKVMDLEFVQFHPTALNLPGVPRFLISEAVRGEGALLKNGAGERFMPRYHELSELAPRDVVARAIVNEFTVAGDEKVYLDLSPLGEERAKKRFPNITRTCAYYGVDVADNMIPVSPAAHYLMGGVKTNLWGETNIKGLYACGEVSCLGVHGANRLASNSLLDGLVFGERIVESCQTYLKSDVAVEGTLIKYEQKSNSQVNTQVEDKLKEKLKDLMWTKVGIIRRKEELQEAIEEINELRQKVSVSNNEDVSGLELTNQLLVSYLIAKAALIRTESRGGHYRADYPAANDEVWQKHIILQL